MTRARLGLFRALGLALAVSVASSALAQADDEKAARALFKEGLALQERRDFSGAITKYRAAYARWKNPKILTNIGTAAWELGHFVEAAEAYDGYLAEAPGDDPNRGEVLKAQAEVSAKVGTLGLQEVAGATVTLDGNPVVSARGDRLRVMPGAHVLVATHPDGTRVERRVEVAAGATQYVSFADQPARHDDGETPVATSDAPAPAGPSVPKNALAYVVGGAGVVSLIASGVFFIQHRSAVSDLEDHCLDGVCPGYESGGIDDANTTGTLSIVTLGIGVAAVGVSLVMLSGGSDAPEAARLGVSVAATPGGASGTARLRF